jgi:hypothetical protein
MAWHVHCVGQLLGHLKELEVKCRVLLARCTRGLGPWLRSSSAPPTSTLAVGALLGGPVALVRPAQANNAAV